MACDTRSHCPIVGDLYCQCLIFLTGDLWQSSVYVPTVEDSAKAFHLVPMAHNAVMYRDGTECRLITLPVALPHT